ncbi:XisI protein [Nostoc calcicola FACHB-389]|nr:XisI protein [Nostoc calcicola FACHB-3891]OKH15209.1 XisI protein [Nostoc calcicola FACHB-389]
MDKLDKYRQIIKEVLNEYSKIKPVNGEIEVIAIFNNEVNSYQIIHLGWENRHRIYGCTVHIDIKDDKVWIQNDNTEVGIANELVDRGIPKKDIVLGYQAPYLRHLTDFAVS